MWRHDKSFSDISRHSNFSGSLENGFGRAKLYPGNSQRDSLSIVYGADKITEKRMFVPINDRQVKTVDSAKSRKSEESSSQNAFGRIFSRFTDKTSMQGVNYIASSKLIQAKIFWSLMTVVAIVLSIIHMYVLIDLYTDYPKQTKLSLGFNPLLMPAVTICNANPIRKSMLDGVPPEIKELMEKIDPEILRQKRKATGEQVEEENGEEDEEEDEDFYDIDLNETIDDFDEWDDYYNADDIEIGPRDIITETHQQFLQLYGEMDGSERNSAGHQLNSMMIRCSIKGRKCSSKNFTVSSSMNYGNCYTLQSDKFILDKSGPDGGLTVVLHLENFDYIEGFSSGYGVRVVIHEVGSTGFPHEEGFFVSAGQETNIGLRMRDINRLGDPFGKCESGTMFQKEYGVKYTRQTCQYFCAETKIHELCKCYRRDEDDILKKMKIKTNKKWCNTKSEMKCMYRTINQLTDGKIKCECLNPCREYDFEKSLSAINWPSYKYAQLLTEFVCEKAGKNSEACLYLDDVTDDKLDLRENFLKINIYFESLNFEKIEEAQDYEDIQFISDVGGAIGLWIGLSILSIFELGQLMVELLHQLMYRQSCRYNTPPSR